MRTYQVEVSISKQENGLWRAEVPVLPGCFVDAETLDEAVTDIQDAIRLFIASNRKHGDQVPLALSTITESDLPQSLNILISVP